jgi:hypothetical protein
MKAYKIQKRKDRIYMTHIEVKAALPKPRMPKILITKIHKPEFFVEFVFKD